MTVAAGSRARAAAAGWAQEHDLGPDDAPASLREGEDLVLARVLLAQDLAGRALALAEALTLGYLERHARVLRAPDLKLAGPGTAVAAVPGPAPPLTPRERQVLGLLAAGQANRDIADELVISLDTVKRHVSHILAKLGAANRTKAVARARQLNLIP
jgi:LuxR family transcriptional regulator, maltose regulon positive regulatory protein